MVLAGDVLAEMYHPTSASEPVPRRLGSALAGGEWLSGRCENEQGVAFGIYDLLNFVHLLQGCH